jgi:palmitoyl-protein thioesterase
MLTMTMNLVVASMLIISASSIPLSHSEASFDGLLRMAEENEEVFAAALRTSSFAALAPPVAIEPSMGTIMGDAPPTVTAHGMGDSCFNAGFKQLTQGIATHTGSYAVCIPTGDTQAKDTNNGFFLSMENSLKVFAAKIRADPKLADGFNAIGLSQGNSLIRGYIQKYNDPPVMNWLSIHGTVVGVTALPNCNPAGIGRILCETVAKLIGDGGVYSKELQNHIFQADYFRDPARVNSTEYKENSEIGEWNNEGNSFNASYASNFAKTKKFVMVKAAKDTMVYPNDGEWWGAFADGKFKTKLAMNETRWYKQDLFGLKTADQVCSPFNQPPHKQNHSCPMHVAY